MNEPADLTLAAELTPLTGERGIPSVNDRPPSSSAKRVLFVLGTTLITATASAAGYWKYGQHVAKQDAEQTAPAAATQVASTVPTRTFENPPPDAATPALGAPPTALGVPPLPGALPPGSPQATSGAGAADTGHRVTFDPSASTLMIPTDREHPRGTDGSTESNGGGLRPVALNAEGNNDLGTRLNGTKTPPQEAGFVGNRNLLLAKGSFIDCALQTKLDSTVPGMTSCMVTRNIYSDNGKVLLVERGSTIVGEYQANVRQGMARIFVLWTRIKTPNGVIINIDSPGTDSLGAAGLPGYVDNHFWARFGGALMLSLVGDAAQAGVNALQNGPTQTINFNNTSAAGQNVAAEALRNTINIPPTLYKNQGEQVGVYIARDLDFSSVYDVTIDQ